MTFTPRRREKEDDGTPRLGQGEAGRTYPEPQLHTKPIDEMKKEDMIVKNGRLSNIASPGLYDNPPWM